MQHTINGPNVMTASLVLLNSSILPVNQHSANSATASTLCTAIQAIVASIWPPYTLCAINAAPMPPNIRIRQHKVFTKSSRAVKALHRLSRAFFALASIISYSFIAI